MKVKVNFRNPSEGSVEFDRVEFSRLAEGCLLVVRRKDNVVTTSVFHLSTIASYTEEIT